ncbi:hypothetical protein [Bradyrhizobium sp. SRL28]|uniref:hypothetical protein n=1 Tax=Bradyrhizobium sp. SRL28 TaxID=2836178 RepID=UPI00201C1FD1|nr:hypothetical protein [Bradyrhizobium sp. SRL28]
MPEYFYCPSASFEDPIILPDGRKLLTLKDAADYITKLPKKESDLPEWQTALEVLLQPQRSDDDGADWGHESAEPSCRAGVQSRSQRYPLGEAEAQERHLTVRRPGRPYGRSVLDHGPVAPAVVVGIAAVARRKYEPLRRPMSKVPAANLADVGEGAVRRPEWFVVLVYDERRPAVGFVCGIVGKTLQPRRVRG